MRAFTEIGRSMPAKTPCEYSLDTVKMFYEDARKAGYQL